MCPVPWQGEVWSVASQTHPSTQDDIHTIAAKTQTTAQAEGFGELGLMGRCCAIFSCFRVTVWSGWVLNPLESMCAGFALFGMSHWCWLSYYVFTEVLDHSVTLCSRSETGQWRAQAPTLALPYLALVLSHFSRQWTPLLIFQFSVSFGI